MSTSTKEWILSFQTLTHVKSNVYSAKASDVLEPDPHIVLFPDVTDAMIDEYLLARDFVDTKDGLHQATDESSEYHAQRIASLIHCIRSGIILDPVVLYCCHIDDTVFRVVGIDDGWHRLRASCYLNAPIRFSLDFNE